MGANIYDNGTYAAANPRWHAQDSTWKAKHLLSLLDDRLVRQWARQPVSVAEIGCGFGGVLAEFCHRLRRRGVSCSATGYDISSFALGEAARRHPTIRWIGGDFRQVGEGHDIGLVVDLLEHLQEPRALLVSIRRTFSWILFHIPLDENWYGKSLHPDGYYEYLKQDRGHLHYFTKARAFRLLRANGMHVVRWKYTPKGIQLYRPGGGHREPFVRWARLIGMCLWPDLTVRVLGGASLACLCTPVP